MDVTNYKFPGKIISLPTLELINKAPSPVTVILYNSTLEKLDTFNYTEKEAEANFTMTWNDITLTTYPFYAQHVNNEGFNFYKLDFLTNKWRNCSIPAEFRLWGAVCKRKSRIPGIKKQIETIKSDYYGSARQFARVLTELNVPRDAKIESLSVEQWRNFEKLKLK